MSLSTVLYPLSLSRRCSTHCLSLSALEGGDNALPILSLSALEGETVLYPLSLSLLVRHHCNVCYSCNPRFDCCMIPESLFYLEGKHGLLEFVEKRLKENGHMVIVVAEGVGKEIIAESIRSMNNEAASGNKLQLDVGRWLSKNMKDHFTRTDKMTINLKYIGYTGFTIGPVNGRHAYIPFHVLWNHASSSIRFWGGLASLLTLHGY